MFAFTLKAALFHDHHRLHLIAHADAMVESLLPSPLVNAAKSCTSLAGVPTPREDGEVQYQYLSSHQQCRVVVSFYQFNLLSINVNEANNFLHDNRAEHFQATAVPEKEMRQKSCTQCDIVAHAQKAEQIMTPFP